MRAQGTKLRIAAAGLIVAVAAGMVMAADAGLSQPDRDFVRKAAQGGQFEVAAGKLAAQRAQDPAVKAFAQKMVSDHTAANNLLKSLADSRQLTLPDSLSSEDHDSLGKLEGLNGHDFDKAYSDMMVKDHVADIREFETEVKKAQDADVKSFAEQTLETLRHHLMLANHLSTEVKKGA
jgi:putative membrane protein